MDSGGLFVCSSRRIAGTSDIDLVISDMHMPGLDGLATAKQLRRSCQVPIILMAGSWRKEQAERASGVGAQREVLRKSAAGL